MSRSFPTIVHGSDTMSSSARDDQWPGAGPVLCENVVMRVRKCTSCSHAPQQQSRARDRRRRIASHGAGVLSIQGTHSGRYGFREAADPGLCQYTRAALLHGFGQPICSTCSLGSTFMGNHPASLTALSRLRAPGHPQGQAEGGQRYCEKIHTERQ